MAYHGFIYINKFILGPYRNSSTMTVKINNVVIVDDSRVLQNLGSSITITQGGTGATTAADARTNLGVVATGAVTGSGLTMTAARVLGRTTAATGAIEEMTVGTGLSLSGGVLSSTSAATGAVTGSGLTMSTAKVLGRTTAATGAIEEMTIGSGLALSGGVLSSTAGGGSVTSVSGSGGSTGLTLNGGPITGSGTLTVAGTLAIASGGTGATTSAGAKTNLGITGPITGSGLTMSTAKLLGRTTAATGAIEEMAIGTGLSLSGGALSSTVTSSGGTVTSVSGSGGSTGLTLTGGPITGSGTLTVGGTLALASGGTGATTAPNARTNLGLGTAAVMTGPSGTIVGTTDTQSLSNKTITNHLTINNSATDGELNGISFTNNQARITFTPQARNYIKFGQETFLWYANGVMAFTVNGIGVSAQKFTPQFGGGFASKPGMSGAVDAAGNKFNFAWVSSAAQLWVDDTNIGNITTSSDRRIKHNIQPLSTTTDKILALKPVEFNWKNTGIFKDDGISHWGFIADEVQTVIPNAVEGEPDRLDVNGNIQPQLLSDRPIIAALVKALQETINRIDSLETRLIALETTP